MNLSPLESIYIPIPHGPRVYLSYPNVSTDFIGTLVSSEIVETAVRVTVMFRRRIELHDRVEVICWFNTYILNSDTARVSWRNHQALCIELYKGGFLEFRVD